MDPAHGAVTGVQAVTAAQFYHAWADGAWQQPLTEHVQAMKAAGFGAPLNMGVVGTPANRAAVYKWLDEHAPGGWQLTAEADKGFEEITLTAIRDWALERDGCALYMHDKGAMNPGGFENQWRRVVTADLVGRWQRCLTLLDRFDTAGCHWLHPGQDWPRPWPSDGNMIRVSHPHYSGNFWWATAAYLRTLPPWPYPVPHYDGCCGKDSVPRARGQVTGRWLAELWIGLGNPQACDLYPGMPGEYARLPCQRSTLTVTSKPRTALTG